MKKKAVFALWNPMPCTLIEICTSEELNAIVRMEPIGPPKRGYISTRLYGVTQQKKGNFHSQGRDNVIPSTQIQCGPEIRISSFSWPEWDKYGDEITVLRQCDTVLEPASEWEGIVISATESVCLSGCNNRFSAAHSTLLPSGQPSTLSSRLGAGSGCCLPSWF